MKEKFLFLLISLILKFDSVICDTNSRPIIRTNYGLVRGVKAEDGNYVKFLGIPYAHVNRSNLFGDSIPPSEFVDIYDATHNFPGCLQVNEYNNTVGSIDCLKLNIYVPNSSQKNRSLPVLIYLNGDNFKSNKFNYSPKFLMKRNITIVNVYYRIGLFGFLCPNIPEVTKNQGIRDQLTALRWIKDNISNFEGDPKRITLSGHSLGSVFAHIHFLYVEENLFNQVILASGTAFMPSIIQKPDNSNLFKLSTAAGSRTNDLLEAFNYVSKLDPIDLIQYEKKLDLNYSLCFENYSEETENIITDYPANIEVDEYNINMLIGNTLDDGKKIPIENSTFKHFKNSINRYLANEYNLNETELLTLTDIFFKFYSESEDKYEYSNFMSDLEFHYPSKKTVEQCLKGRGKIYFYEFSYKGNRNVMKQRHKSANSPICGYDFGYIFDTDDSYIYGDVIDARDQLMVRHLTKIWANFVKYGDPTPHPTKLLPLKWSPVTNDSFYYVNIDSNMTLNRRPYHERMAFWDLFNDIVTDDKLD